MDPLAPPRDRELLRRFCALCGLPTQGDARQQLSALARAFSLLPYENLTKIVKDAESGSPATARRGPDEVLRDFQHWRAGGTCFSLTATLLHLVRALGLQAEPILADRRYGDDTHCALVVWLDGSPHLLDPGYLIVDPLPLSACQQGLVVATRFNQLQLVPSGPDRLELHTTEQENRRYRLTFKTSPVDAGQFQRAWDASFDWDMMHYPLLTKVTEEGQLYMRGSHLQRRSTIDVQREEIPAALLAERIAGEFHIHPDVIHKALEILRRGGDRYGRDKSR
jgi:arylamine N-acetyltransferase